MGSRATAGALALLLAGGLVGCVEDEPPLEPSFSWSGVWIDIEGYEREPDETCAGSFEYLDAYAGVMAEVYGVDEHLGVYRWYGEALFEALSPCGSNKLGCAGLFSTYSSWMPHEHELVHLASDHGGVRCPAVISEGLAEYYGTLGRTPSSYDVAPLLELPKIEGSDYALAGAFAAHLVDEYGLDAILDMCAASGAEPDVEELSQAMSAAFGVTLDQVLADFESWPMCHYEHFRSKIYECGREPIAELGELEGDTDETLVTLELGCEYPGTIGPRGGEIWTSEALRVHTEASYLVEITVEDGEGQLVEAPPVEFKVIECGACKEHPRTYSLPSDDGLLLGPFMLAEGEHVLELRAEAGFVGSAKVQILGPL